METTGNAPSPRFRFRRIGLLALKVLISTSLLVLLISKVGGAAILSSILLSDPFAFLGAVCLYLLTTYFSTLRWQLLVPSPIGARRLFSMYMIGAFFNAYLPGGIGGDAVKAYYLSRELAAAGGHSKAAPLEAPLTLAIASVFMDRYIGFGTLLVINLGVLPFGISYLQRASSVVPLLWVIPVIVVLFVLSSLALFKFRLGQRIGFLARAYQYVHTYAAKGSTIAKAVLYSAALQILVIASVYLLAQGLSLSVSFLALLIFVPIIIVFSMIPVSIAGIGLREGAFVFLLGALGVPPEKAITLSLLWFLSVFTAGLWGLVEYLRFKRMLGGKKE